jgi:hypothetical protein
MMQKNNKDLEAAEAKPLKANLGSKGTLQSSKKRIIQWRAAKNSNKELDSSDLISKKMELALKNSAKMDQIK